MLPSGNGVQPTTMLGATQAVILSAGSQRYDGAVLPLPESLKIKGGAVDKDLGSLKTKSLIVHQRAPAGDDPPPLRITRAGLSHSVEPEDDAPEGATRAQYQVEDDAAPSIRGSRSSMGEHACR